MTGRETLGFFVQVSRVGPYVYLLDNLSDTVTACNNTYVGNLGPSCHFPGGIATVPLPPSRTQIHHFQSRLFIEEMTLLTGRLPEPGVQAFYGIRDVHQLPRLGRIRQERGDRSHAEVHTAVAAGYPRRATVACFFVKL